MIAASDDHWWYQSTRQLLTELATPHLPPVEPRTRYLDAAGGSGATGRWLAETAPTVAGDIDLDAVRFAADATPGYLPAVMDLNALAHPDETFDATLCVTALCHRLVPDPQHVVAELARTTRRGGIVVLMEPGVRRLRRGHDELTHTARRFSRSDLAGLAVGAGLDVIRSTGAYAFLIPPAAAIGVLERRKPTSDVGRNQSGLGGVLPALASAERRLLRRFDLPVGLSVIVVARRP